MSIEELVVKLRQSPACDICPAASDAARKTIDEFWPRLPESHQRFMTLANGTRAYHGHFSVFGINCHRCIDLARWNRPSTWRFAWEQANLSGWLFFAQNSWGEQYGYRISDLDQGSEPKVFHFGVAEMDHGEWVSSFEEFAESLLLMAERPFIPNLVKSFERFGEIPWGKSLAYSPSLVLGGTYGDPDGMMLMDSESQMTVDGDIHTQVRAARKGRGVASVMPYQDSAGRMRMKVNFVP